jgi:hypothetical protein
MYVRTCVHMYACSPRFPEFEYCVKMATNENAFNWKLTSIRVNQNLASQTNIFLQMNVGNCVMWNAFTYMSMYIFFPNNQSD